MLKLWAVACVAVILAALPGPVYNHSFVEMLPSHGHLHMAHAVRSHTHLYELAHAQSVPPGQEDATQQSCALLPSDMATGTDSTLLSSLQVHPGPFPDYLEGSRSVFVETGDGATLSGISVLPPTPPPRTTL